MKAVLLFLAALGAWAAEAPAPSNGKAVVTIYRHSGWGRASGISPALYMDGIQIAEISNKRYFSIPVTPGVHRFWSDPKEAVEINAEADKRYFILASPEQGVVHTYDFRTPKLHLFQVAAEQGEKDIRPLQPLDTKHIFNAQ